MGFIGMVSFSIDPSVRPDLGFFSLLLKDQTEILSLLIIILGLALTISTVDTLVNAISSLFVVDGKATFNLDKKTDYLKISKYFILILSVISFGVASKGFDILYLFLLADLFCCAFVVTVFYSFYNKVNEKTGKDYWYFAEQYFYSPKQPILEYFQNEDSFNFRWNNVNDNFIMPIDLLVNGSEIRVFPSNKFQKINVSKHSQIEVMDWKFYVEPVKKNKK